MRFFTLILGLLCLAEVLLDAFQTIILPRRASGRFRVSRIVMTADLDSLALYCRKLRQTNRRESFLSYFGPLSLLMLVVIWASGLIFGFGLIFHSLGSPFSDAHSIGKWETDLYVSGTTLFTLGLGDVVPLSVPGRILVALEGGMGLAFVAGVIGYLPVLYGAFSRTGSQHYSAGCSRRVPRRRRWNCCAATPDPPASWHCKRCWWNGNAGALSCWRVTFPIRNCASFARSMTTKAGLAALVAMLDTCAVLIATVEGDAARQAQLTFRDGTACRS